MLRKKNPKKEITEISQSEHAYLYFLPPEILVEIASYLPEFKNKYALRCTARQFSFFQNDLHQLMVTLLIQSIIDDKLDIVKKILNVKPDLLLLKPKKNVAIESQYTWQKFYAEKPLIMALINRNLTMVLLLLHYFKKLEVDGLSNAKDIVLQQWQEAEEIWNTQNNLAYSFESLLLAFESETFSDGINGELKQETRESLEKFVKDLLPDEPVALTKYFNIEHILCAAFDILESKMQNATMQLFNFICLFCLRVIGFLQSLLNPEFAKSICQGIYDVVKDNKSIEDTNALSLKVSNHENGDLISYYRESRETRVGLGFTLVIGNCGFYANPASPFLWAIGFTGAEYKKLIKEKEDRFLQLKTLIESGNWPDPTILTSYPS